MGFFGQSAKKSKALKKAILIELGIKPKDGGAALKELYDVLLSTPWVGDLIKENDFSFEDFLNVKTAFEDAGFTSGKSRLDYYPIMVMAFARPLSLVIENKDLILNGYDRSDERDVAMYLIKTEFDSM